MILGTLKERTSTFPTHGSLRTWGTISSSYKGVVVHLEGTARSTNCSSQSLCGVIIQRNHFPPSAQKEEKTKKTNKKFNPTVPYHTLLSLLPGRHCQADM